jgi:hypothetical protein
LRSSGAALAAVISLFIGIIIYLYMYNRYGVSLFKPVIKLVIGIILGILLSRILLFNFGLIISVIIPMIFYFGFIFAVRLITFDDLNKLKSLVREYRNN